MNSRMKKEIQIYKERIKELRKILNLSQQDLSDHMMLNSNRFDNYYLSREEISRLERGKRSTELPYVKLISVLERIIKGSDMNDFAEGNRFYEHELSQEETVTDKKLLNIFGRKFLKYITQGDCQYFSFRIVVLVYPNWTYLDTPLIQVYTRTTASLDLTFQCSDYCDDMDPNPDQPTIQKRIDQLIDEIDWAKEVDKIRNYYGIGKEVRTVQDYEKFADYLRENEPTLYDALEEFEVNLEETDEEE